MEIVFALPVDTIEKYSFCSLSNFGIGRIPKSVSIALKTVTLTSPATLNITRPSENAGSITSAHTSAALNLSENIVDS